jgi:predicted RNase H-like HicB family nuclease
MKEYLIVIEKTDTGYSSFSPDLPGCIATGTTREEAEQNMKEAVEFHIEGLKLEGHEIPSPEAYSTYIKLSA